MSIVELLLDALGILLDDALLLEHGLLKLLLGGHNLRRLLLESLFNLEHFLLLLFHLVESHQCFLVTLTNVVEVLFE